MAHEFIYTCYQLARHYPPDRTVLENISLSFYPGAKIGVIGSNGSGKSSLLRIMAGLDDGFTGEARLTPGFTVGLLEQEPQLDPSKDVLGNVMDGVGPIRDMLARYEEVMAMWGDPDADYEKVGALQAELEDKIATMKAGLDTVPDNLKPNLQAKIEDYEYKLSQLGDETPAAEPPAEGGLAAIAQMLNAFMAGGGGADSFEVKQIIKVLLKFF